MLLAQWILSSEAAFAAGIVAFLLLLAMDLLSAPSCTAATDELPAHADVPMTSRPVGVARHEP